MKHMIRVLIADDTEMAREGLRRLLADVLDITVIGEARTIYEAVRMTRQLHPDIVLMDLKWSGDETAGVSAIELLRQQVPESKIIAITVYDHLVSRAREAGAHLAVTKDFKRDELHAHIREVHRAEVLPPARSVRLPEEPLTEPITAREREVLTLLAEGLTDRQIAEKLVIAENTAKNHVVNILAKLGASNRTQAVIVALRKRLLEVPGKEVRHPRR